MRNLLVLISFGLCFRATAAPLQVETTLPDFKDMIEVIGGDEVVVRSLLQGVEDPHFLDAKPAYVARLLKTDLLVYNGLELEIGWLPKIVNRVGNPRLQEGGEGSCVLGSGVSVVDRPTGPVDRSLGHVHASGNPHFNLSPQKMSEAAVVAATCLSRLRPEKATQFQQGLQKYQEKMRGLSSQIQSLLSPQRSALSAGRVMEYHQNFVYFFKEFGIKSAGSVEEKPGVAPSAGRLAKLNDEIREKKVAVILVPGTLSDRGAEKLNELSGVRILRIPVLVQAQKGQAGTEALLTQIATELATALGDAKP